MNVVLQEIYSTQHVVDESGSQFKLSDSISIDEGEFLTSLILENRVSRSIEIGCAYGISSLFVCEALAGSENPSHLIVDPHQYYEWNGIGMNNLRQAGYSFVELIEEGSEIALPRLVSEGQKYDFGFIDGFHTFDHTLVDLFYMNLLIEPGGIITIHDMLWKSVSRAVSYVSNYPCYEIAGTVPAKKTVRRNTINKMRRAIGGLRNYSHRAWPERYLMVLYSAPILINLLVRNWLRCGKLNRTKDPMIGMKPSNFSTLFVKVSDRCVIF